MSKRACHRITLTWIDSGFDKAINDRTVVGFEDFNEIARGRIGAKPKQEIDQSAVTRSHRSCEALVIVAVGVITIRHEKRRHAVEAFGDSCLKRSEP